MSDLSPTLDDIRQAEKLRKERESRGEVEVILDAKIRELVIRGDAQALVMNRRPELFLSEAEKITPLERDILVCRHMLGGETILEKASKYHPEFRKTQVTDYMNGPFKHFWKHSALIVGGTGNGKTSGMVHWLLNNVEVGIEYGRVKHCNGAFINAYDLSKLVDTKNQKELDYLARIKFLGIDDLGTEPVKGRGEPFLGCLHNMFRERHQHNRYTVFTSNLGKETHAETILEIQRLYGLRFYSRLAESGELFVTTDPDFRLEGALHAAS
jgi:hypothetical protein